MHFYFPGPITNLLLAYPPAGLLDPDTRPAVLPPVAQFKRYLRNSQEEQESGAAGSRRGTVTVRLTGTSSGQGQVWGCNNRGARDKYGGVTTVGPGAGMGV